MGNREGKGVTGNSDIELDVFKREIDLRQLAVSLGYAIDRRQSWSETAVCRQPCYYRRGSWGAYGWTAAATRCSRISTPLDCAATKSKIAASPALPPEVKRDCGSRIHGVTTGV